MWKSSSRRKGNFNMADVMEYRGRHICGQRYDGQHIANAKKENAIILDGVKHTFVKDKLNEDESCTTKCSLYGKCRDEMACLCGFFDDNGHFEI